MSVLLPGTKDGWGAYLLEEDGARDKCHTGVAHDQFLARRAIRIADFVEESGVYGDCGVDAGAGHWRQYGTIFRGEWSVAKSTTLSQSGPASCRVFEDAAVRGEFDQLSKFSRLEQKQPQLLEAGGFPVRRVQHDRPRGAGTAARPHDFGGFFSSIGYQSPAGTKHSPGRG